MDYYMRSQINVETAADLETLLAYQESIKHITLKRGEVQRLTVPDQVGSTFTIQLRTKNPKEIRDLFNGMRDLIVAQDMTGQTSWHECRHQEKDTPCTWNETFIHKRGGIA